MARKQRFTHKHYLLLSVTAAFLVTALVAVSATSSNASPFNTGKQTNSSACDTKGKPVINVTEKVKTVDSGQAGNYWAFDDVNRNIQVWRTGSNEFCAVVQNTGKFDSQAGQRSPGNTGILTGKEDGTFKGGYRAKIVGALKTNPEWAMKGNVGTHDYGCDLSGTCNQYVNWVSVYFGPDPAFSYEWWGWNYTYKNHTWVNSSDGNSGDIL